MDYSEKIVEELYVLSAEFIVLAIVLGAICYIVKKRLGPLDEE